MKEIPQHTPTNKYSRLNIIEYFRPDNVRLNLPFILTCDKKLTIGMPYLYSEGHHSLAVRLIDVWEEGGIVYLQIQNLVTHQSFTLSWNLYYTGEYWLWSLSSLEFLIHYSEKSS